MIYKFVTKKQKKFLENTCFALGITLDELMEVQDISRIKAEIKALKEANNSLVTGIEERDTLIKDITNIVNDLKVEIQNMQNEEIMRELSNVEK